MKFKNKNKNKNSPAQQALFAIKAASQLFLGLDDFALEKGKFHDSFAVFGADAGEPDALGGFSARCFRSVCGFCRSGALAAIDCVFVSSVDHDVGRILVPAYMADEVNAHPSGPLVVQVAVETQGA